MRYLSFAGLVVIAGAATAFACGDGDSSSPSGDAGEGGALPQAGSSGKAGSAGKAGSGGKAGSAAGGSGAEAGDSGAAGLGGDAGTGATAGGGTGGTSGGGTGGTAGGGTGGTAGGGTGGTAGGGTSGTAGGGTSGGGTGGAVQGSLGITLSGVPVGATASIAIAGPDSYANTISATSTVSGLAAGSYAISAPPIRVAGTQVDSVYDATVTGSPATVALGATSNATVSYALRSGTGSMWVTNYGTHNAYGFDAATIAKTGAQSTAPGVALTFSNLGTNGPPTPAIAFSATGDMWVGTCRNNQTPQVVAKFAPSKISATGSPTASVTLTMPATDNSYDCASALAFDTAGNLWVGMYHGHILRFNAADLAASGTPAPAINLTSSTYFNQLFDIAFDSAGNLFVQTLGPVVPRLSAAQLLASDAAIVPAVLLTLPNSVSPGGLALGSDGALWVSDYNSSSIFKLKSADLGTTGSPTPTLTVTLAGDVGPQWIAFDKVGNLWVAAFNANSIIEIGATDTTTSGTKAPVTSVDGSGALNGSFGVRFNPGLL